MLLYFKILNNKSFNLLPKGRNKWMIEHSNIVVTYVTHNFGGVFGWFTSPITMLVGLIIPIMLLANGFNSNWDVFLIDASRFKLLAIPLQLTL